jgi:hypothetical protein
MYFPDFQAFFFFFVKSFPVCLIYIFSCHAGLFYSVLQPLLISLDLASLMLSTPSIIRLLDWNNTYFVLMAVPGVLIALQCVSFIYSVTCVGKPNKAETCLYTTGIRLSNRHVRHSEVHRRHVLSCTHHVLGALEINSFHL